MNYDNPKQPIDSSFAPMVDTLWEARERQRFADIQRGETDPRCIQFANTDLEDAIYPERKAQRIQAEFERRRNEAVKEAESLSDRELLEEIYVMLKMKHLVI